MINFTKALIQFGYTTKAGLSLNNLKRMTKQNFSLCGLSKHSSSEQEESSVQLSTIFKQSAMIKQRSMSNFHKYRKWEKVVQPLVKYDRESSEFSYPLTFFYQLQQHISGGYPLALNIATTLTGAKDNCLKTVFDKNEEIGTVVFSPAILKSSFDADIQKQMQERLARFCERDIQFASFYANLKETNACDQMLPWAVIKQKQSKGQCRVMTHSRDQYKKIVNLEANQVAQCFIWGSGKQASINRFFYFPYKQNSQAYKIDNLQGFLKKRYGKGQFKVRQSCQNSLTFVKIMYTNKSFYKQSINLVQFLEKHNKIKIIKLVTDWILDPQNRYFLIDVKQLSFTKAETPIRIRHSLTDALAYLSCAVCQQKFRQEEVTKTLTDRLITQFFEHLKKRQIYLSFTPPAKHNADLSRLCEQCYMLVVSESELMQLQKEIATITHSIKPAHSLVASPILTGSKGELFQWRLFFYLEDIKDLMIQNDPKSSYYIMIRIHNAITSFKLKNPVEKYQLIKAIKIHYLFSESQKIDKFLSNSEIIIRITKGNNWNSVLAEGSTSGLYEESQKHSMRKFKQILVFNQNSKYSVVGIHIGIKMEGKYDPSHLALQKTYDVYMVEDGYSNCYALPAEWMETIDPSYCITKSESTSFNYSLHLGASQKKSLLPSLPKHKKKLVL